MNNIQTENSLPHSVSIKDRASISVTGVTEVISFDDSSIVLKTGQGGMAIEGSSLKIDRLSVENGEISADGKIDSVYYFSAGKKEKSGFLRGMFR